ncbi:NADH-quinone oxidoreductase subunit H [Chloroflexi bacterium TSY]|nr:NADH-quinone oxidoreductase subunit H [Chloroflexi bacterium TSY]
MTQSWLWSDALRELLVEVGLPEFLAIGLTWGLGAFILTNASLLLALVLIWITRKVISRIQDRIGPNRVGPFGLFQTVADAVKLLSKENISPANADFISYNLAPILTVFGVLMLLAVVPFAPGLIGFDLNIGVLYLVALGSVGIMADLMAGWGSNNKYALLAGFRIVAQLLSYEIPMVLAMLAPVLLLGTMRMGAIAEAQSLEIFGLNLGIGWLGILMPGAFLIFFIAALAESEQTPFDLLEAESELISGFHIEYSGMKFAMFFLGQFLNTFFLGAIAVTLFMGGWQGPLVGNFGQWFGSSGVFIDIILGFVYFNIKVFAFYVVVMWVKGTFPRIRVDQMMAFAWKALVPLVLVLVLWQMIALKLPGGIFVQYLAVLVGNLVVIRIVLNIMSDYFQREQVRTKRAFEPKSLIGTMQPVGASSDVASASMMPDLSQGAEAAD